MHQLHIPLILLGVCLLLFLALPELRRRLRRRGQVPTLQNDLRTATDEPTGNVDAKPPQAAVAADPAPAASVATLEAAAVVPQDDPHNQDDKLLLLHLLPGTDKKWSVGQVAAALESAGLFFGDLDIFHYPDQTESGASLFSVANINEPGTLNPTDTQMAAITGLVVFRRLSGDARDARACACMLRASKVCCQRLGATLHDGKMHTVGDAEIKQLRQRFIASSAPRRGR